MIVEAEISDQTAELIKPSVDKARPIDGASLSIETLAETLLRDIALMVRRPRDLEAEAMANLFEGAGYEY